jgi:hypothetical protein
VGSSTEAESQPGADWGSRDDDAQVTGAISAGDVGAFESVYDRYAPQACGLAL